LRHDAPAAFAEVLKQKILHGEQKRKKKSIRKRFHADCPIVYAFRQFTQHLTEWWPYEEWSVVELWLGGRLIEPALDEYGSNLGIVVAFDPPERITIVWYGENPGSGIQISEVRFRTDAERTEIILNHVVSETIRTSTAIRCFTRFAGVGECNGAGDAGHAMQLVEPVVPAAA
jgi:hypothetical protein